MPTPAEHYHEAEACITEVMEVVDRWRNLGGSLDVSVPLALAQVHATLANATDPRQETNSP